MRKLCWAALAVWAATAVVHAQTGPGEYDVKAVFLYNFVRLVDWPEGPPAGPIRICVAGTHPIELKLEETLRGESFEGQPLTVRTIAQPEPGCEVLFVPRRSAEGDYLRAVEGRPVLTVGESSDFIQQGGMINFFLDGKRVRFEINPAAVSRANLRISSRLLQLARLVPS
jgi:hypothetical protein